MTMTDEQAAAGEHDDSTQRREVRLRIDGVRLPFLGTRLETRAVFQYVLLDLSFNGARIILPDWAVRRDLLHVGQHIDFHLPFLLDGVTYNQGRVAWTQRDEALHGQVCGVHIETRSALYYPVYIAVDGGEIAIDLQAQQTSKRLLCRILKDTILLKRGILIYFEHFKPIVRRMIRHDPERAAGLRSFLFEDAQLRIEHNIAAIERERRAIGDESAQFSSLSMGLDLDALRVLMEPEIDPVVWIHTFQEGLMHEYLTAIISLETKIFYNFNTIVMIYAETLISTESHNGS
jgi:hypothetical protein